ncbi:class I SAM-dependent methyltransferase [Microbacterium alcoholitolerans]|uniref:class I SAM-dependent methyltransferase n=1 Tax=unclassified Microbacterium TaxID=2609290 RepID=UPI003D17A3F2
MTAVPDRAHPRPDPVVVQALASDLDAADFRSDPLRRLWGDEADDALARGMREPILRAIAGRDDALSTIGRLWVLGMPQPLDAVERAVPRVGVDALATLGLAEVRDMQVVPLALIRPQSFVDADGVGEWWIASDLDEVALGTSLPADHVLGVGGASRTLAELVIPTPVERALDLGTGCGIQALLIARHAGTVIATDISERALAYAELNAQLNGVHNIVFRLGSLFEPVAGEVFDLIVSNPPFVITPRVNGVPEYEYRDGGLVGDALVEQFLSGVPAHLAPGGIAQLLGNWESRGRAWGGAESGLDRVRGWIDDALDAWVIQREELTPLGYAELWIRDGGILPRDEEFTRLLTAWLDDFAARDVTAVGFGYILLRRPSRDLYSSGADTPDVGPDARNRPTSGVSAREVHPSGARLRRFETVSQPVSDLGRALRAGLAAHDALIEGIPQRLVVAADVTEARHYMPGNDDPSVIELRQGGGFGRTIGVDSALAGFVGACDGELTVAQIAAALADLFDVPLGDLWADLEPRIRQLVLDGMLVPAE